MSRRNPGRHQHIRNWFAVGTLFCLNLIAFNNCSDGFKVKGSLLGEGRQESSSETPVPITPVTAQPTPVPIEPIAMNNQPSWMQGKNLNEWIEIPNTSGAGGASIEAFSGMAFREATSELIIGAAGGHGDGGDNRVVSLVIATDHPKWVMRIGPSPYIERDVAHYKDGTPSARHTYQSTFYIESLDRLFLFGAQYTYGLAVSFPTVDAFSFKTNQWDPPNTWAPVPPQSGYGTVKIPGTDDVFLTSLKKWSAAEATAAYKMGNSSSASVWSTPITTRTDARISWPLAYDKMRNQLFTLQYGDGLGYDGPKVSSSKIDLKTGVQTNITIKPSTAYSAFLADAPVYASMDYDPENDRFLFYSGLDAAAGRVFVVKPSSTSNEWEMSILATTANSPLPPASTHAGLNSNFKYVPALKGFVLLATKEANVYFIKTAQ